MKVVLVLTLLIALALAGCRQGHSGTNDGCYCWCQYWADVLGASSDARCHFRPGGAYGPGECVLCASNINSLGQDTSSFENSLSDAIMGIESNDKMIFPLRRCTCPGSCASYSGSHSACSSWAQTQSSRFLNEQYTVTYFARSTFSSGGCTVCGLTDPCKTF
ncbi:hypothetical protein GEMRC1_006705 [Eukaryota sp. GEM-RC1]